VTDLTTIKCPKCGSSMGEVIHAEANTRKGWWCKECNHWITTTGREKFLQENE
jgi:transposase-like protein|tara:strand:- start:486 stop:644 length:159 start_codon:yes stop_codon:yes gene_type:complete